MLVHVSTTNIHMICTYIYIHIIYPLKRAPEQLNIHQLTVLLPHVAEAACTTGLLPVGVGGLNSPQLVPNSRGQFPATTRREDGGCPAAGEISGTEIPISSPLV